MKMMSKLSTGFIALFLLSGWLVSCEESLPPRIVPQNVLEIVDFVATQGTNSSGRPIITMMIIGKNQYHETFYEHVDVTGHILIWWNREPDIEVHVPLTNANFHKNTRYRWGSLTLDPGEEFSLVATWAFYDDHGDDVLNLLDYSGQPVTEGIIYARPEKICFKAEFKLYHEIGLLTSEVIELTVTGWKKISNEPQ